MRILLTNDDGPPSKTSSPYIHPFVLALRRAGHTVSVILPHQQRSWIGKAHFVSQLVRPVYYRPGPDCHGGGEGGVVSDLPFATTEGEGARDEVGDWVLIDGTPATATQLGLFHLFSGETGGETGAGGSNFDLVISGPNYGRNTTALFSLSSGTVGGAMEAATFGVRAVAISFAFWTREYDPRLVERACRHGVEIVEGLVRRWDEPAWKDVAVWSVNVPLLEQVGEKVMVTRLLENTWGSQSCFKEVTGTSECAGEGEGEEAKVAEVREKEVREAEELAEGDYKEGEGTGGKGEGAESKGRVFKWVPKFSGVQKSIDAAPEGNDGWAITKGYTSLTPLRANYMQASGVPYGELKLSEASLKTKSESLYAIVEADDYLLPIIHSALKSDLRPGNLTLIDRLSQLPQPDSSLLQIRPYEFIDFDHLLAHPSTSLANSYVIRKALIRKHYLWQTISSWWVKHPDDKALKGHVPLTVTFELDYAEFLDEALLECYELHESFAKEEKEWWILKPAMSDQGQGVRLFSSEQELRAIFEEWESDTPEGENEDEAAGTMTSQLRHFVAQRYIERPLLFEEHQRRKFHIRSYVLAVGALTVYLFENFLALFAPESYSLPQSDLGSDSARRTHLTNTCLQSGRPMGGSVEWFSRLPKNPHNSDLKMGWQENTILQIRKATATLFEAAAREQMVHFQTLPNAFEVFGLDWMVDEVGNASLLEVNAFPDFKQSGTESKWIVEDLWKSIVKVVIHEFFGDKSKGIPSWQQIPLVPVLDIDLGRG